MTVAPLSVLMCQRFMANGLVLHKTFISEGTKKESAFCRAMARELRVSKATVLLVWSENEIKPHLTRVVKLSTDPDFEAKFSGCHRSLPQSSRAGSGALV
jgi:hypothetical protein